MKKLMIAVSLMTAPAAFAAQTAKLQCQKQGQDMVAAILKIQEKADVTVKTLHADISTDDVGNTVETYDIQGFKAGTAIRVPSQVEMFAEEGGCALMRYSLPNAN